MKYVDLINYWIKCGGFDMIEGGLVSLQPMLFCLLQTSRTEGLLLFLQISNKNKLWTSIPIITFHFCDFLWIEKFAYISCCLCTATVSRIQFLSKATIACVVHIYTHGPISYTWEQDSRIINKNSCIPKQSNQNSLIEDVS